MAASTTRAPTATATVRPTSARRRLGAKSWVTNRTKAVLEAGQDLLPLGTLHEVDESLDPCLHLSRIRVVHEVHRTPSRARAVRQSLPRRVDAVDGWQHKAGVADRLRVHCHDPDRVLDRL